MTDYKPKVAVLGAGSFGTVLANNIASNGFPCMLYARSEETSLSLSKTGVNAKYLPNLTLNPNLQFTSDVIAAVTDAQLIMITVPSSAVRSVMQMIAPVIADDAMIVSGTKGIEPETFELMSEVIHSELPNHSVGALSGPNLAKEIAAGGLAGSVIASHDQQVCERVQACMSSPNFRIYSSDDIVGVELAGVLKNIYAILAGISSGMDVGANMLSMLITRSLAEMCRYAAFRGANPATFLGLSGVGDLIATCISPLSRNFQVGKALGEGLSIEDAKARVGQTAEGLNTVRVITESARSNGISMPLSEGLYAILYQGLKLEDLVTDLMSRGLKPDVEFKLVVEH